MDTELIKNIADEIVTEKILHNWEFYGIIIFLFFVAFCVYAFVGPYLTGRGKQYARKSDIDAILDELKKTTRATEEIKSDIEKGIWIKKEWNILRRQKLEELLVWLSEYSSVWIQEKVKDILFSYMATNKADPIDRASAIHKLYFPELDKEMAALYDAYAVFLKWTVEGRRQQLEHQQGSTKSPSPQNDHMKKYGEHVTRILSAISAIEDKARVIMDDLRTI